MARTIGKGVVNIITINDPIGGGDIEFRYRFPTTTERQQYSSGLFSKKGVKIRIKTSETRQKFGLAILTGIREGDFILQGEGFAAKTPVSSKPDSPHYRFDWKDLVSEYGADLVEAMAAHVFEGAEMVEDEDECEGDTTDNGEVLSEKN